MTQKKVILNKPFMGLDAGVELVWNSSIGNYEFNYEHQDISANFNAIDTVNVSVSQSTVENNIGKDELFSLAPEFKESRIEEIDELIKEGEKDFEQLLTVHKEIISAINDLGNELADLRKQRTLGQ
jgi:hypothetical protein